LELDLRVWASLRRVGETDSPDALLDYRDLYKVVCDTVHGSHHTFLEGLCERIAARALEFHGVQRARVAARKPHVPLDGPIDHVEVVVDRQLDE
jgi:dihydroneopterin aldolase